MSLREQILGARDIQEELVEIPEWGGVKVLVRGLTGRQRAQLLQNAVDTAGKVDLVRILPELVIYCVYDPETRQQVFRPADRDALLEKSGIVLERIATVAMRLSGLTPGAMEEMKQNLREIQSADSILS